MGQIKHIYTSPVADGTATSVVRPTDWNSQHAYTIQDAVSFGGNTAGVMALVSSGTLVLAGGNNITLSQDGQSVTVSGATIPSTAGLISAINVSAGTTSNNMSALTFANSNGVSFGLAGSVLTGTVATNYQSQGAYLTTAALSNHSHGNPTLALTNLSGTTASNSAGLTLSLSAGAGGAGDGVNILAAGSQTANTTGTVLFNNSNGITFGMSNNSVITAAHNALTTAAASDHSHGNPTLALTNLTGTTASASNGFTLSLSAAAPGAGGAIAQRWKVLHDLIGVSILLTPAQSITSQIQFLPMHVDGTLSASECMWQMSRSTSGSNFFSLHVGMYSFVNNTQISLIGSNSHSFSATATASVSGVRQFEISMGSNFSTFAPGDYVFAMLFLATNTASFNYSLIGGSTANPGLGIVLPGADQYSTATTHQRIPFWGRYSANSGSLPNSVGMSEVRGGFSSISEPLPINLTFGYD